MKKQNVITSWSNELAGFSHEWHHLWGKKKLRHVHPLITNCHALSWSLNFFLFLIPLRSMTFSLDNPHPSLVHHANAISFHSPQIHSVDDFVCSVNSHLTTRQENERLKGIMARIESYDVVVSTSSPVFISPQHRPTFPPSPRKFGKVSSPGKSA